MEEMNRPQRPVNPRRRRKTKMQIFKEAYLPVIIAGAAFIFILVCIIGSIVRSVEKGVFLLKMMYEGVGSIKNIQLENIAFCGKKIKASDIENKEIFSNEAGDLFYKQLKIK